MVLVQHQKNYLGAPDTQGVFEKYLEALANIKELVFGPCGPEKVNL